MSKRFFKAILGAAAALTMLTAMAVSAEAAEVVTEENYLGNDLSGEILINGATKVLPEPCEYDDVENDDKNWINYKVSKVSLPFSSAMVDPDGDGPKASKEGKLVAVVTSSADMPKLKNGKVVKDKKAEEVLKANVVYIDGESDYLRLTANKRPGIVYVHILDINCRKEIQQHAYQEIRVGEASTKLKLTDENGEKVKNITVNLGRSTKIYLEPQNKYKESPSGIYVDEDHLYGRGEEITIFDDETYNEEGGITEYLSVYLDDTVRSSDNKEMLCLNIDASKIKRDTTGYPKITTLKFFLWDRFSGKKYPITVNIVDRPYDIDDTNPVYVDLYTGDYHAELYDRDKEKFKEMFDAPNDELQKKKDSVELFYHTETMSGNDPYISTDKLKFYVCKPDTAFTVNKSKVKCTKSKDVSVALKTYKINYKDERFCGQTLTVKANTDNPTCDIYAVYTDTITKDSKAFLVAKVVDGVFYDDDDYELM